MWVTQYQQGNYITVVAHPVYQLIAAATEDTIYLFDDELNVTHSSKRDDVSVQVMKWHPTRKFLAIGWKNGVLNLCKGI
jgi:hypothetical protein